MTAIAASALAAQGGVYARESVAELLKSWRLPQFILPTVITPAAFYALFTLALSPPTPARAAANLAAYGVFAAIGPSLFGFGAGVAMEREQGLIEMKRVSPMPIGAFIGGKLAAAAVVTAAALALIYAASLIAGVRLEAGQWTGLLALHLASVVPFALIGLGLGMRLGGKGAVGVANALFLGFAVIGGLWIPAMLLPGWMQAVGQFTPSFHLGQLANTIVGAPAMGTVSAHIAAIAAITAAAGLFAWTGWHRSPA